MSEFFKFVTAQWHDIKGNAKWDFIKLGAIAIITVPAAIIHFIGHAPLWEVLVVLLVSTICVSASFCVILWAIHKWYLPNKSKLKSKEEELKEDVDKIARWNFPERFEQDDRRKKFTEMVDYIRSENQTVPGFKIKDWWKLPSNIEPIGALVKFSYDIKTENELKWYCDEFGRLAYKHPFLNLQQVLGDGFQWLPVLMEARLKPREIRTEIHFLDFLAANWSGKEKWNSSVQNKNSGAVIAPTRLGYTGAQSSEILHTCSQCGFGSMIPNPFFIAIRSGYIPTFTCPKCQHTEPVNRTNPL